MAAGTEPPKFLGTGLSCWVTMRGGHLTCSRSSFFIPLGAAVLGEDPRVVSAGPVSCNPGTARWDRDLPATWCAQSGRGGGRGRGKDAVTVTDAAPLVLPVSNQHGTAGTPRKPTCDGDFLVATLLKAKRNRHNWF